MRKRRSDVVSAVAAAEDRTLDRAFSVPQEVPKLRQVACGQMHSTARQPSRSPMLGLRQKGTCVPRLPGQEARASAPGHRGQAGHHPSVPQHHRRASGEARQIFSSGPQGLGGFGRGRLHDGDITKGVFTGRPPAGPAEAYAEDSVPRRLHRQEHLRGTLVLRIFDVHFGDDQVDDERSCPSGL